MAARKGRAVRADPGTAKDRRHSVRKRPVTSTASAVASSSPADSVTLVRGSEDSGPARLSDRVSAGGTGPSLEVWSPPATLGRQRTPSDDEHRPRVMMTNPYALIYSLEQHRGSFEILLLLDREGMASKYRMREQLMPRQQALDSAVRCLERMGLVELERGLKFPFEKRYHLTGRGKEFAATIRAWPQVLPE